MELVPYTPQILEKIRNTGSFYIIPHIEPDGDCLGSALALGHFLTRIGKKVSLHNLGPFDRRDIKHLAPQFHGRIDVLSRDSKAAAIILDCSTLDRIGDMALDIQGLDSIVIDHHSAGKEFGTFRHINATSPSASLLVQQLIEALGYAPDEYEATWIMFAFCTDTGYFRHLNAGTGEAFRMVSRLVDTGVSPKELYNQINSGASLIGRKHLGALLQRTESYANDRVFVSWEYKSETDAIGKQNRDSDMLYQMLMTIENAEVVISLREESAGVTNGGLRSKAIVDVGKVALALGGGGHARASGFQVRQGIKETKEKVLSLVLKELGKA